MSLQSVVACRSVKDFSDPVLDLIERTYTESFPEVERRDFSLVRNLVRDESRFIVYALSKEDRYVGFITGWLFDGYTYVEHFAIDPAARNGGIGAEAMKQFLVFCGTPVVLEVEMPTDEMSKRRIGFYERLGFVPQCRIRDGLTGRPEWTMLWRRGDRQRRDNPASGSANGGRRATKEVSAGRWSE